MLTFIAAWPKPTQLTVTLPFGCFGRINIDAFAVVPTIAVFEAFVPELTKLSVVQSVTFTSSHKISSMAVAVFSEFFP